MLHYWRYILLICVLVGATCGPLPALDQLPSQLSVSDAVAATLRMNPNLIRSEDGYQDSLSRLRIANYFTTYGVGTKADLERADGDSGVSSRIYGDLTYQNLHGTQGSVGVAPFGLGSERGSIRLSVRHPLMKGSGPLSPKSDLVQVAHSDALIRSKELFIARQSTVLGVVEAYYRAVLARDRVDIQERALAITEEAATGARRRAEAGLVAEIEVSRAEIRVAQTRDQLNLQRQAARGAIERLMLTIGTSVDQNPQLTDGIPDMSGDIPTLTEALTIALHNRTELSVQDERIATQMRKLAIAEDQFRPSLDVVAGLNSVNRRSGIISGSFFEAGSFATGVELRLPIDKRVNLEERNVAERGVELLHTLRTYQMEEIAEQVRRAYRSVESAQSSLEILGQNLKVAEENLHLAQRMVDEGLVSNRDVLEAQEALTRVESGLLSARIDLYLAGVNLLYAMGEDLTVITGTQ